MCIALGSTICLPSAGEGSRWARGGWGRSFCHWLLALDAWRKIKALQRGRCWWNPRWRCQSHLRLVAEPVAPWRNRQSNACWGQQWWRWRHQCWHGAESVSYAGSNVQSSHWFCWYMDSEGGDVGTSLAREQDTGACNKACVGLSGNGLPKAVTA